MAELVDSPQGQLQLALIEDLKALQLEEIGDNWHARRFPWMQGNETAPIGFVCQVAERILREGLLGLNDIRYRFIVAMIIGSNGELSEGMGTPALWRNTVFNRYHRSTCLHAYEVTGLMGTEVEPGIPNDAGLFVNKNYDAQYLTINARFRLLPAELP